MPTWDTTTATLPPPQSWVWYNYVTGKCKYVHTQATGLRHVLPEAQDPNRARGGATPSNQPPPPPPPQWALGGGWGADQWRHTQLRPTPTSVQLFERHASAWRGAPGRPTSSSNNSRCQHCELQAHLHEALAEGRLWRVAATSLCNDAGSKQVAAGVQNLHHSSCIRPAGKWLRNCLLRVMLMFQLCWISLAPILSL